MEKVNIGQYGEKKNEGTDEQISQESPLSLTQYKSPSLQSIPRLRLLAVIVPEKSLTEKFNIDLYGEKKNERTNE